jgi:hypothetical protein
MMIPIILTGLAPIPLSPYTVAAPWIGPHELPVAAD